MIRKAIITFAFLIPALLIFGQQQSFIGSEFNNGKLKLVIPDSLLGKDILFGSRIVDISSPNAKVYSAGQMRRPPVMIRFRAEGKMMLVQEINNFVEVEESDPVFEALQRNQTVGSAVIFDIESRNSDDNAYVIDVTRYFSEEVQLAWPLPDNVKKGRLEPKLSGIRYVKEYPDHINIRSYYEFTGGKETFAITVQYFMLLLPEKPLLGRYNDDRIGYQPFNRKSFVSGKAVTTNRYISRWRLEPSPGQIADHKEGKLVKPASPIVMYIEPYFPKEWIPYIKLGIEDWNSAFEKIGFKDVMVAREFPHDPDFDPYDIKTNVVRYLPLEEANAAGQIWTDPRSGEILNGEVLWWNDVVNLINMWRFTQTAAVDPKARLLEYDTETIGQMIRYAVAHEVGHVLGLQHNMRSSYAYPVDSLRSPTFTAVYGTTASIMDYARNNHVARPGDLEKGVQLVPPVLGPFDHFSIEYGYRYLHGAKNSDCEKGMLDSLFDSVKGNPYYKFAPFQATPIPSDPSAQPESLGNDIIVSSRNGIANTRIILDSLVKWTVDAGGGTKDIQQRYDALSRQYFRYISLAISYLGGVYNIQGPVGSGGYVAVSADKQKAALKFVIEELSNAPMFLENEKVYAILGSQRENILKRQGEVFSSLLNNFILPRVANNNQLFGSGFGLQEYMTTLDGLVWNLKTGNPVYDMNLKISYVQSLVAASRIYSPSGDPSQGSAALISDAAFSQLNKIKRRLDGKNRKGEPINPDNIFLIKLINNSIQ